MKVAAGAFAALYVFGLIWAFAIFVVDAMNFGIHNVVNSPAIIYGGDMYGSFEYLSEAIYGMPSAFGTAVLYACVTLAATVFTVLLMCAYKAAKQICHLFRRASAYKKPVRHNVRQLVSELRYPDTDILKLCCRANC